MEKLLFISLSLLLSGCNGSKPAAHQDHTMEQTEQPAEGGQQGQEPTASNTPVTSSQSQEQQAAIKQGITGKVVWEAGNQMPSPDAPPSSGGRRGVQRTLYIHELTNGTQATTREGVFHTNIRTNLVTQVNTDADGNFTVSLKPGKYSIFSKEEQGLYANLFDGQNNIFPVEVKEGQLTTIEFLINYEAVY
jgi:hypothetical protein